MHTKLVYNLRKKTVPVPIHAEKQAYNRYIKSPLIQRAFPTTTVYKNRFIVLQISSKQANHRLEYSKNTFLKPNC
jgi:hypothetical protein